jgi:hypothetical protein
MSTIVEDALNVIAATLESVGVPATTDPGQLAALVTAHGMCALVGAPDVEGRTAGGALQLRIPVSLAVPPPDNLGNLRPAWEALPAVIASLTPQEPFTLTALPAAGLPDGLPAYQTNLSRRTACPRGD